MLLNHSSMILNVKTEGASKKNREEVNKGKTEGVNFEKI